MAPSRALCLVSSGDHGSISLLLFASVYADQEQNGQSNAEHDCREELRAQRLDGRREQHCQTFAWTEARPATSLGWRTPVDRLRQHNQLILGF